MAHLDCPSLAALERRLASPDHPEDHPVQASAHTDDGGSLGTVATVLVLVHDPFRER
ncbi:hypothetical protein ACW0JT_17335 [Arthrobacter sp. SA17]